MENQPDLNFSTTPSTENPPTPQNNVPATPISTEQATHTQATAEQQPNMQAQTPPAAAQYTATNANQQPYTAPQGTNQYQQPVAPNNASAYQQAPPMPQNTQYQQQPYGQMPQYTSAPYQAPVPPMYPIMDPFYNAELISIKKKSTAALILGIISLSLGIFFGYFFITAIVGIGLAIPGLVLAVGARKSLPPQMMGQATSALVINIIALIINAIFFLGCLGVIFGLYGSIPSYYY